MTMEIALVLSILGVSVVLLVTEWIPMEVTALLALGSVALTGLVSPVQALSGFSNPAVITVWAVFIISGGLTRTGVANIIGRFVLRIMGRSEAFMIAVIMVTAGVMSAVMNNVAVAALMLPVVMDISRHTGTAPSRLLMPLAYGSLLGGLTTQIGTPPNILVTDALRDAGFKPFSFFDFTPIGMAVMAAGTAYMALVGRHLLPSRNVAREAAGTPQKDWRQVYQLQEKLFQIRIPPGSLLVNKTLAQSRIGSALALNVVGITRRDRTILSPGPGEPLLAGDLLTVQGDQEDMAALRRWRGLVIEKDRLDLTAVYSGGLQLAEARLPETSEMEGRSLNNIGFRARFNANVLAVNRDGAILRTDLADMALKSGDVLLISAMKDNLDALEENPDLSDLREVDRKRLRDTYHLHEQLLLIRVPPECEFVGKTLKETHLGELMGIRVMGILREDKPPIMPEPDEILQGGDRLVLEGHENDFEVLRGLEELQIADHSPPDMAALESDRVGLMEVILSPHTTLSGRTLRQLNFREKFGLNVLSILRGGKAYHAHIRDTALKFGDALLLFGPREKLRVLGQEPDFIVLTQTAQERVRREKAGLSTLILAATLFPVIMGWAPIYIVAVVGAALMVLTGCLTMEEAYRQIEWKAVFLIAGMLPLGTALDQSGAARLIAEGVVAAVGPLGPLAVMAAMLLLTFLATCFVPTAALVVLMVPIVLSTAADMSISPYSLVMAVAMAASASFTTPLAHPANILVMGPGGYRFWDYLKVGGVLTLVVFLVLVVLLPVLWPLAP